jgi:hypothetical protein
VEVLHVVLANAVAARRDDFLGGVRIARMEIDLGAEDAELPDITDEGLEFF